MNVRNGARKAFWMGEAPNMPLAMNENQTHESTPDQLLQMLDAQIAARRSRRQSGLRNRTALLAGGLFLIIGGMVVALLILQQLMADVPRAGRPEAGPLVENAAP